MLGGLILVAGLGVIVYVLGTWMVSRGYSQRCPQVRSVYRYQPKTFLEAQSEPPSVFKMYSNMFWNQEPWLGFTESDSSRGGLINPFVLGELPTTELSGNVRESNAFLNPGHSN